MWEMRRRSLLRKKGCGLPLCFAFADLSLPARVRPLAGASHGYREKHGGTCGRGGALPSRRAVHSERRSSRFLWLCWRLPARLGSAAAPRAQRCACTAAQATARSSPPPPPARRVPGPVHRAALGLAQIQCAVASKWCIAMFRRVFMLRPTIVVLAPSLCPVGAQILA